MNYYKNLKDTQKTDDWLRTNGINIKSFTKTKPKTLQAQQAATQLLDMYSATLDKPTKRMLKNFRRCYSDKNKRDRITDGDCYRVLNLAARVKRGEYQDNRRKRQAA